MCDFTTPRAVGSNRMQPGFRSASKALPRLDRVRFKSRVAGMAAVVSFRQVIGILRGQEIRSLVADYPEPSHVAHRGGKWTAVRTRLLAEISRLSMGDQPDCFPGLRLVSSIVTAGSAVAVYGRATDFRSSI